MSITNNFWSAYVGYMNRFRERRAHRATIDEVSKLPAHLRRDIGWPDAYDSGSSRHSS